MSQITIDIRKTGRWGLAKKLMTDLPKDIKRAINAVVFDEARSFMSKSKKAIRTHGSSNNASWKQPKDRENNVLKAVSKSMYVKKLGSARFGLAFRGYGEYSQPLMHSLAMSQEKGSTITRKVTLDMFRAVMKKVREDGREVKGRGAFKPGAVVVMRVPRRSFLGGTKKAHFTGRTYERSVYDNLHKKLVKYKEMRAN